MHTTTKMASKDFSFSVDGKKSSFEDIFPNFNVNDRIGIVVNESGGSIGAAGLFMAAVTNFYDFHREKLGDDPDELWIYPDFFIFHVGEYHMTHFMMEVWPSHKEVLVEDDPEQIMEAINDRGITRLLVADQDLVDGFILKETLGSAKERIVTTLAYSPTGRTENSDIEVTNCYEAEFSIDDALNDSDDFSDARRRELKDRRKALYVDGNAVESFRKIELAEATKMFTKNPVQSKTTKKYLSMSSCN